MTIEKNIPEGLRKKARDLGAVFVRVFYLEARHYSRGGYDKVAFSHHFFNEDDVEVCYYCDDVVSLCGMVTLLSLREWSPEFKCHPSYSPLRRI